MYSPSPEGKDFLKAVSEKSPVDEVRGIALFSLAYGIERDPAAADEYVALLERLINEFPDLEIRGRKMAAIAQGKLFAAKNLVIGSEAPEIIGRDVDGSEMKLSDYRGKIVVIDFWGDW